VHAAATWLQNSTVECVRDEFAPVIACYKELPAAVANEGDQGAGVGATGQDFAFAIHGDYAPTVGDGQ
jgi:hypothetical protein